MEEFFNAIVNFVSSTWPNVWVIVNYVLIGLGTAVVILTSIDLAIPDEKDKGFMKNIVMKIPILGKFLEWLIRFSILRTEK